MDPMLLGETLSVETAEQYLGYWMPAGGNNGVAAVETFYVSSASAFTVHMDTKSSDENDASADAGSSSIGNVVLTSTTPGVYKFDVDDAQDLVRYRIVASEKAADMHFQFAQPLWAPN